MECGIFKVCARDERLCLSPDAPLTHVGHVLRRLQLVGKLRHSRILCQPGAVSDIELPHHVILHAGMRQDGGGGRHVSSRAHGSLL